mmetsp:Transcript_59461/g.97082  ORF Transcript_59461/g.97082 Transcript_59461/m.97082 type:complete len:374 (-) Transcript_59461:19-1140(-)
MAEATMLGQKFALHRPEILGEDTLKCQDLFGTQEALLVGPVHGAVGHQTRRAMQLHWGPLFALGHIHNDLVPRAALPPHLLQAGLQDLPLTGVQGSVLRHPPSANLEVGEIFLQSHGLGRLHLLNHLEDLLDIFRAEAITAKSHHPAAVAALGDHEIAGVQDAIIKVVSCLLHGLSHLQDHWFLAINAVGDALDILSNDHRRSMLFDVIHHAAEGLTGLTATFLNAILVGLAFIVLRGDGLAHETGDENVCGGHPLLPSRDNVQDLMALQGLDVAEEPLSFGEILKDPCPLQLIELATERGLQSHELCQDDRTVSSAARRSKRQANRSFTDLIAQAARSCPIFYRQRFQLLLEKVVCHVRRKPLETAPAAGAF